jgi:hypothetical protein
VTATINTSIPMVKLELSTYPSSGDAPSQSTAVVAGSAYIVIWSGNEEESNTSVFVHRFNADGTIAGNDAVQPKTSGTYVVTWMGKENKYDTAIYMQLFNTDGTLNGQTVFQSTGSLNAQSSESGSAYLVQSDVTVNSLADYGY